MHFDILKIEMRSFRKRLYRIDLLPKREGGCWRRRLLCIGLLPGERGGRGGGRVRALCVGFGDGWWLCYYLRGLNTLVLYLKTRCCCCCIYGCGDVLLFSSDKRSGLSASSIIYLER